MSPPCFTYFIFFLFFYYIFIDLLLIIDIFYMIIITYFDPKIKFYLEWIGYRWFCWSKKTPTIALDSISLSFSTKTLFALENINLTKLLKNLLLKLQFIINCEEEHLKLPKKFTGQLELIDHYGNRIN